MESGKAGIEEYLLIRKELNNDSVEVLQIK